MGWDHHTTEVSSTASSNSHPEERVLHELYTLEQLIEPFDLANVNHKKSVVDPQKLVWLNKMHLRREAARLGEDAVMTDTPIFRPRDRVELFMGTAEERRHLLNQFKDAVRADDQNQTSYVPMKSFTPKQR